MSVELAREPGDAQQADPAGEDALDRLGREPAVALRRAQLIERSLRDPARLVGEQDALREVEYLGDQYGAGTRFWLRSDDLLQRYSWQQDADQFWEVSLECAD